MKKIYILLYCLSLVLLCSCSTTQKSLYSWYNYEEASYQFVKQQTPESKAALADCYRKILEKQKGTRQTVPPGVYAEIGYQLINDNKKEEGLKYLQMEIEAYPESKSFIEVIINKVHQ